MIEPDVSAAPRLVALDWGTSSLRAFLLGVVVLAYSPLALRSSYQRWLSQSRMVSRVWPPTVSVVSIATWRRSAPGY